jgi:hypothetical protein
MKIRMTLAVSLLLLFFCGEVAAQFSQPPPKRSAPTCSLPKNIPQWDLVGTECKALHLQLPTYTALSCHVIPWVLNGIVSCSTYTQWFDGVQWRTFDAYELTRDWAFIIDGQETYSPSNRFDGMNVVCGNSRQGYVRVTAEGSTATAYFNCN